MVLHLNVELRRGVARQAVAELRIREKPLATVQELDVQSGKAYKLLPANLQMLVN